MLHQNLLHKVTLFKEPTSSPKILFIINPYSGNQSTNWKKEIQTYFEFLHVEIELHFLKNNFSIHEIKEKVTAFKPDKVVAVGGDGTINAIAQTVLQTNILLGILPAGSANGMAKELGISLVPQQALHTILNGAIKKIHALKINDRLCIHLSDIGFNAFMIKKFQSQNCRGVWGYIKANLKMAWHLLLHNKLMNVDIDINNEIIAIKASMIVIANATKYGTGAVINPSGNMEDTFFELIVIKKISVIEVYKMMFSHSVYNKHKTVVFKTKHLKINGLKNIHFQVDGEYVGKVNSIEATLIPAAINIIVPSKNCIHV